MMSEVYQNHSKRGQRDSGSTGRMLVVIEAANVAAPERHNPIAARRYVSK